MIHFTCVLNVALLMSTLVQYVLVMLVLIFHYCTYVNNTWCNTVVIVVIVVIVVWPLNKLTYSACNEGFTHLNASGPMSSILNEKVS